MLTTSASAKVAVQIPDQGRGRHDASGQLDEDVDIF